MKTMKDINFFSFYIKQKQEKRRRRQVLALLYMIIAIGFSAYYYYYSDLIEQLYTQINDNNKLLNIEEHKNKLDEIYSLTEDIMLMQQYLKEVDKIQIDGIEEVNTDLLNYISSSLPEEVTINQLNINGNVIHFTGESPNKFLITHFQSELGKKIGRIFVTSIIKISDNHYEFSGYCSRKGDSHGKR